MVIGDVDDRATETAELVRQAGADGRFVRTAVTVAAEMDNLVRTAVETFGGLHVAFDNAGIFPPTVPLLKQSEDDFDRVVAVDLTGVFLAMRAELATWYKPAAAPSSTPPPSPASSPTTGLRPASRPKHGVIGLTPAAAMGYATAGIRANALAHGLVATSMTRGWLDDPEMHDSVVGASPMGRPAEPEEIAGMVMFLASPLASIVNGGVDPVDAGQTAP
ncbi:Short-chain dehydrogenase/reductase SDR [Modestobacter italicus]|uniref:Short-chain dehydrogenase/reductase SDR n=1 Tax=Modestobacter italicus (strain DSM 44449 / CECT 9708 / BC 501) TaxID=2732864 RepID=I4EYI9_MODI5|nr:Short-chain dehydrogenase/reductase SDR [Modestobacter marinus]